ncbi:MAG: LysR substrate-binding domain-containing protein [Roseobacter sp.]
MRNLLIYKYIVATARAGSVRQAAEILAITPSSLNRRIQSLEQELGTPLFERHAKGVRLNPAGEQAVHAFRRHLADIEALKARIEDLKGARRGTVSIVCSQSLLPGFLPSQIQSYRSQFPGVEFRVHMADGEAAERALITYEADLAIVFSPLATENFETIATTRQPVLAIMSAAHKLAEKPRLRLSDCLNYPLALPKSPYAVRNLLDLEAKRLSTSLRPVVETESYIFLRNYVASSDAIGFEIEVGLPQGILDGTVVRPIDLRVSDGGLLHLAQLRGRALPVGAAKFAEQVATKFDSFS